MAVVASWHGLMLQAIHNARHATSREAVVPKMFLGGADVVPVPSHEDTWQLAAGKEARC